MDALRKGKMNFQYFVTNNDKANSNVIRVKYLLIRCHGFPTSLTGYFIFVSASTFFIYAKMTDIFLISQSLCLVSIKEEAPTIKGNTFKVLNKPFHFS